MIRHFFSPATGCYLYSSECPDDTPFTTDIALPEEDASLTAKFDGRRWLLIETQPLQQTDNGAILADEAYKARSELLALRHKIFEQYDIESLLGKTSNALVATLNLQMQIYQRLAVAQSFEDVRAAILPAWPLMQRVQGMLARGELLSVQTAQGMSDEEAVIEALEAMTKAARVIKEHTASAATTEMNET